jgi:hypothetical protein
VYNGLELSQEFQTDIEIAKKRGTEFLIDPMPPIDLVAVKTVNEPAGEEPKNSEEKKSRYYTLFWYVSPNNPDFDVLEQRLRFYQFHLSRVVPIKAIEMILVMCKGMDTQLQSKLGDVAGRNGFGLWKFEDIKKQPLTLYEPSNFRKHMEEVIADPPKGDKM